MNLSDFLLSQVPFSPEELEEILSCFEKKEIPKNTMLIQQGEISRTLYFIENGMGRSYYLKKQGKEITQWFFGSGKFMASADSFFQKTPSLYYLELLEDSIVYTISREKMDMLFSKYHKMDQLGRLVSIEMLTKVVNKLNAIQFQTAKERYEYMLEEFPDIYHRIPLGHIASYLGMTQETLSRIRR
ncbi:Crp/Fnr family transcriptional regulator [Brumimicrobium aurantiacum]|uniref:Crp/Fnr family transcriptional regulator n=1 Tax=Brumimicrobium aurantiacum TaxID=1737063 RepID=A0A3E1F007_9FLAO|nr:Crp/Fnr family transcriptional regulator [Brumimicrobium aurantiacum]RFC55144.1 Crp/Fnr family transcriptional regulator [Brumimicrobium aurantiacum]